MDLILTDQQDQHEDNKTVYTKTSKCLPKMIWGISSDRVNTRLLQFNKIGIHWEIYKCLKKQSIEIHLTL